VTRRWAPAAGQDERLLFGKRTSFDAFKPISSSTIARLAHRAHSVDQVFSEANWEGSGIA
jgi:hypothetical protein